MLNRLRSLVRPQRVHSGQTHYGRSVPATRSSPFGVAPGRDGGGWTFAAPVDHVTGKGKARHFARANAYAAAAVNAYSDFLIGFGVTAAPQHESAEARQALSAAWAGIEKRATPDGQNMGALASQMVRSLVIDGEALIHIIESDSGVFLQPLAPEQLDSTKSVDLAGDGYVREGVEFSAQGERVAYWLLPHNPADPFGSFVAPVRVPARDVIHIFEPTYPGQVRGESWFLPVLTRLGELDKLEDAISVGVGVAAMFAGVLYDHNGTGGIPFDGEQFGNVMESGLEPGTLKVLPSGYDVKFSTPQQAPQAVEFAQHEIRAIASGLGVPQHLISGDLRQANYSSLRADMLRFRQRVESIQWNLLIPQFFQRVFERAITSAEFRGKIDFPGFWDDPSPYYQVEWFPPRFPTVDPQKEAEAIREELSMGLISRRQAVAERGFNVEELDAEIAADREREKRLGLSFSNAGEGNNENV